MLFLALGATYTSVFSCENSLRYIFNIILFSVCIVCFNKKRICSWYKKKLCVRSLTGRWKTDHILDSLKIKIKKDKDVVEITG